MPPARHDGTPPQLLIVDGDESIRHHFVSALEPRGYVCTTAADASEAFDLLAENAFSLVLSEVTMPGRSGLELVMHVLAEHPSTAALVVTGTDDAELADQALELGVHGYAVKPLELHELVLAVANALRRRALEDAVARLERSAEELRLAREQAILRLSYAAEFRDPETGEHIDRMSRYCTILARRLGVDAERCELIRVASLLHDVGKVAIPDAILLKDGPLTLDEREIMERHAQIGYRILAGSGVDVLDLAATFAQTHHERFDGSGYPYCLAEDTIPLECRIAAIADVYDALSTDRPYRPAFRLEEVLELMRAERGRHFDPVVLDAFFESLDEVVPIMKRHTDVETTSSGARQASWGGGTASVLLEAN